TIENAQSYLLGPVFGLLLRLRGITCLHASAVAFEDRSVVFVGPAGAGKSTTAAAFAARGFSVLSDDIAALSITSPPDVPALDVRAERIPAAAERPTEEFATFRVLPAYPHLCLWPDSIKSLYGAEGHFPRLAPEWEKQKVALGSGGMRFETRELPLAAIYLFSEHSAEDAPRISPVPLKTALLSLLANTYANNLLDAALRAEEFRVLDRLVASVPVRLLTRHSDAMHIEQLCSLIYRDFRTLERA
ncbi:MAG: hypothetical protein ABSG69_01580, partial [Candidatus Acidiferrum sp.]